MRNKMTNDNKKPTVMELNYAFDSSPVMFESIMNEAPVQYGPQELEGDTVTTPEGDEVVDPRGIMDVNVSAPIQSGPVFNSDVEPISNEDGDKYMNEFEDYIQNLHKIEISDEDLDVAGATIQMLNNTRQDVTGFIRQQIADATARLNTQNSNPAMPDGVSSDMTGEGRLPSDTVDNNTGVSAGGELNGSVAEPSADIGGMEVKPTTHLTPEPDEQSPSEQVSGLENVDLGLGGGEPNVEPSTGDAGAGESATEGVPSGEAEPSTETNIPTDEGTAETESGSDDTDNYDPFKDLTSDESTEPKSAEPKVEDTKSEETSGETEPPAKDEENAPDKEKSEKKEEPPDNEDTDKEKKDTALTESVEAARKSFSAKLESILDDYRKRKSIRNAKIQCESIVANANKKLADSDHAIMDNSANEKSTKIKAKCESIIKAYNDSTKEKDLTAKLESIIYNYKATKEAEAKKPSAAVKPINEAAEMSALKAKCESIISRATRYDKLTAKCESIVNGYRATESNAEAAKKIIDKYNATLA